ncbi:MAG: TetR/AcrR family transcriptional regulator [Bacteroidota bacterium]
MPRSQEQYDDIRKQKKELIMNVALELFAENGYHATSISQIARKAEISKGLTYNYFKSKKEILDELIEHGFNSIFASFDLNQDGTLTEEEFIYFIKQSFKLLRDNMKHWKLFFSLMLQPQVAESFSKDYQEKGAPMFQMLFNFIQSKGSEDPEGDLMVISAMLEGAFLYCVAAPDIFPMEIMEEKIINACFKIING